MSNSCAINCDVMNTGNDVFILNEIHHALKLLIKENQPTSIDLRSMPLATGEEAHIEDILGKGEIEVTLDAMGSSKIIETSVSGVWIITHYNLANEISSKFIEVTHVPDLICSPKEDLNNGLERLGNLLNAELEQP